jgi:hypothetical protein
MNRPVDATDGVQADLERGAGGERRLAHEVSGAGVAAAETAHLHPHLFQAQPDATRWQPSPTKESDPLGPLGC